MKRTALQRLIPFRLAALVAPLIAAWPHRAEAANGTWNGAAGGTWHTITNWTPNTAFPGEATAAVTGEGLPTDIALFTGANTSANVGVNMNTMGGQLTLGAIDMVRTTAGNLVIGNNSTTNGILRLDGATVNSVANTLIRVSGGVAADLTIANVNTGSGTQTMGLRLGINNGIFHVDNGRTLVVSSIISQAAAGYGFQKNGAGTMSISGNNTYTGAVSVNDGVLRVSNNNALGTGTGNVLVTNGGAPGTADNNELQVTGGITVNRNLILENLGNGNARTLLRSTSTTGTGANAWSGNITIRGGSNQAISADSSPLTLSGQVLNDGTTPSTGVFFRGGNTGTIAAGAIINLGSAAFVKTDGGTWNANNTTSMTVGSTQVSDGTLTVGANNALSTTAPFTIGQGSGANGTLNIASGISQLLSSVTVAAGSTGTQRITGPGSLDTGASNRTYLINDSAGIPQDLIISAPVTGSGGFTKTGAGTLAVNSAVTGPVTVSTGRLEGSGTFNGGLNMDTGAIHSPGTDFLAGTTSVSALSLNGANSINLNIGAIADTYGVTGAITAGGTTTLNITGSGTLPNSGTIPLITHDGTYTGTGGLVLGTLPGRLLGTLDNTAGVIGIAVSGNDQVIWTGAAGAPPTGEAWDINTTQNWKLASTSVATGFLQGDDIIFDGTGANTMNVTLNAAATPVRAQFLNNTGDASPDYVIKGSGGMGGAMILDKTGTGNLTLAPVQAPAAANTPAHSYTGQTTIGAGTMTLDYTGLTGASAASATVLSSLSNISIAGGSTLSVKRDNQQTNLANSLSGSGTLLVDITNGGTAGARNFLFSGSNAGFSGTIKLSPTGGGTTGTFRTLNASANGGAPAAAFGTASIEVDPGAQFWGASGTYTNTLTIAGAGYAEGGGGATPDADLTALGYANYAGTGAVRIENGSTLTGNITLDGAAKIQVINNAGGTNAGSATISGNITNTTGQVLVVGGASTNAVHSLILTGDNSGLEQIWVNSAGSGGTGAFDLLQIGNGGTTGTLGSGNVTLHADAARAAVLRIFRSDGYTLASGQQILGDVTGTTVADLARTRLDLNVTGTGFDNAGNTIDLRDAGANGGDILIGNTVAGALANLTGTIEARNLQVGVLNTTLPSGGAVLNLGKPDGSAATTVNVNAVALSTGGNTAPLGNTNNSTININPGVTMNVSADFHLGEQNSSAGTVNQSGGGITIGGHMRIGHWPNATSNYNISAGSLTFGGASPGTTPSGTAEATTGGFYLGVDGTGNMTISGTATVNTKFAVLDNRGAASNNATPGTETLALNGGTLNLESNWGIIARHPLSSLVSLNGGSIVNNAPAGTAVMIDAPVTVGASGGTLNTSANATSSLVLTRDVTGAGNNVTLTGAGKLTLNPNSKTVLDGTSDGLGTQVLGANLNSGTVPIEKIGTGTTTLSGTNTNTGALTVTAGRLNLTGSYAGAVNAVATSTLSGEGTAATISLPGASSLLIDGGTAGALTSTGTLTAAGVTSVDFYAPPTTSIVTVLNHGGTTATPAEFALVNAASYRTSIFAVNAGNVTLDTGRKDLTWAGTTGTWEIAGADGDWNTGADNFFYGDGITFNDSNGSNTTIALTGTLQPSGITVNSDTNQFVLNGSAGNLIAGTGGLLKDGTSILTVNAPNTFSGGSVIREGTVNLTQAGALGTGSVTLGDTSTGSGNTALYLDSARTSFSNAVAVSNNGTGTATLGSRATVTGTGDNNQFTNITLARDVIFDSNASDRTDYENISGTGNITITITGTGRTVFPTTANFTGDITVSLGTGTEATFQSGVATAGNQNYIPDTSNLTVNDTAGNVTSEYRLSSGGESINGLFGNGTVDVNAINGTLTVGAAGGNGNFAGVLQNGGASVLSLAKAGAGTQILTGANSYTGTTAITGGILQAGNGGGTGQLGTGNVTLSAGAALNYNRTGLVTQTGLLQSAAAGAGTLNINGDGTTAVVLNGASANFSGIVNVNGGALIAGATNPWNTALNAPTINIASGAALAAGPASNHAHFGALNLSGGTVSTAPTGTGSYDGENFQLNGDVTVTGSTPSTITRDVARTDANSGIALRGVRTFNVGNVTSSAAVDLFVSTELENTDAGTIATAGVGGIIKAGPGTMSLAGTHSYTGITTVNAGTLQLEVGSSIAASSLLTVNSGATLSGSGATGPIAFTAGSIITPGSSPGILNTGSATSSADVFIEIGGATAGNGTGFHDQISTTGSLTLDGGLLTVSLIDSYLPNTNDAFDIWLNDGGDSIAGAGMFTGLPEGSQISIPETSGGPGGGLNSDYWLITYFGGTGNDIRLTYVPEPSTALLGGAAALLALARRRRSA